MDLAYPLDAWTLTSTGIVIALAVGVVIVLIR